jgi:hypothetical protein
MEPVPRIGMKVIDPIYLLSKPDLKRDFLYFNKLAIDPSGFKLCYSAAGYPLKAGHLITSATSHAGLISLSRPRQGLDVR